MRLNLVSCVLWSWKSATICKKSEFEQDKNVSADIFERELPFYSQETSVIRDDHVSRSNFANLRREKSGRRRWTFDFIIVPSERLQPLHEGIHYRNNDAHGTKRLHYNFFFLVFKLSSRKNFFSLMQSNIWINW